MKPRENSLLPLEDAREAALFFVVGALCFLAALAALSAKSTYGAARAWTAEVEGEFTVSLSGADATASAEAAKLLAKVEGVKAARAFTDAEINELLEPNFGQSGLPADLPVPRLIAVTADTGAGDLGPRLSLALHEAGYDAAVDAHSEWAGDVRHMLAVSRIAALSIVALLSATAIAVIAFATHAALLARRDIVDVLHIAGARDRFIASLFERRFWLLGLRAGTVGALVALASVAVLIALGRSGAERTGLLPQLSLDFPDLAVLVVTPVIAGLAARIAAGITVMRSLKTVM
ncbi:MAG: cell division protein FtsX [Hyphomonas sp.]|uniref:cell division protein FtsX n=1 Tax=Hyphomonas sp. TaxID=87 RepID=UPI00180AFA14|nr:cell division protein FtsX [Hyphomonas sp.]MBA3070294.1 cell division protein FtsX [Hyphomonas sp.]MBU4062780.1 cell division protein FtsX [Alphaproteobacteria bacterium]MBU4163699.1 cell division protein FtsX [Alphaproteobacteria bacterium]